MKMIHFPEIPHFHFLKTVKYYDHYIINIEIHQKHEQIHVRETGIVHCKAPVSVNTNISNKHSFIFTDLLYTADLVPNKPGTLAVYPVQNLQSSRKKV